MNMQGPQGVEIKHLETQSGQRVVGRAQEVPIVHHVLVERHVASLVLVEEHVQYA